MADAAIRPPSLTTWSMHYERTPRFRRLKLGVRDSNGQLVMESIVETKASSILQFIHGLRGELHVNLGRRNVGVWALRSAATPGGASAGLRSAAQCLVKGRQQERQDRRLRQSRRTRPMLGRSFQHRVLLFFVCFSPGCQSFHVSLLLFTRHVEFSEIAENVISVALHPSFIDLLVVYRPWRIKIRSALAAGAPRNNKVAAKAPANAENKWQHIQDKIGIRSAGRGCGMSGVGTEMSAEPMEAVGISAVRFAKKGEFVTRTIAGEVVVVPVRGQIADLDAIYHFNDVGGFIWSLFDGKTSLRDIAEAVCEEFDGALQDSERDTLEFVGALQRIGIIEPLVDQDS